MLYIHQAACLCPGYDPVTAALVSAGAMPGDRMTVKEPAYPGIPANLLRRMGKSGRMGVGVCMPLLQEAGEGVSGILIGTANGGTEDSFRFLQQMVEFEEEVLSPGGFVQSTANGLAAQLSLMTGNRGYNVTHVHRGLAFEQALQDAFLLASEDREGKWLVAGVDELSHSNFVLDTLQGWYRPEGRDWDWDAPARPGTIAGEGAAGFIVSGRSAKAIARIDALATLHTEDAERVEAKLRELVAGKTIDLLITGVNRDSRLEPLYSRCAALLPQETAVVGYKRGCGDYPTSTAVAVWLAGRWLGGAAVPAQLVERGVVGRVSTILIYNNYKGSQHSFLLVSAGN